MPSRHRRRRRDKHVSGPIDALIYMLSACSAAWSESDWYSDDDTEATSHSSDRRRHRQRSASRSRSSSKKPSSRNYHSYDEPRSRSLSVRPHNRGRSESKERKSENHRSRSYSLSHNQRAKSLGPLVPGELRENVEIRVDDGDDDVSALSAGTLEQMERIQILQHANKSLQRRQEQFGMTGGNNINSNSHINGYGYANTNTNTNAIGTKEAWSGITLTPSDTFQPLFAEKENIVNNSLPSPDRSCSARSFDSQNTSMASSVSDGTSVFESVWKQPDSSRMASAGVGMGNCSHDGANIDNYHLSNSRSRSSSKSNSRSRSRRISYESANTRKMRRQIQRDGIGTIQEAADVFSDEEEI